MSIRTVLYDQFDNPVPTGPSPANGGLSVTMLRSAASTNAALLKAFAGNIFELDLFNRAAYDINVNFYNATANPPIVGTTTIFWPLHIPAGKGYSRTFQAGLFFSAGIGISIVKSVDGTTAVAVDDIVGPIQWF